MMLDFNLLADAWAREDKAVLDTLTAAQRRALGLIASGGSAEREFEAAGADFVLGVKSTSLFRRAEFDGGLVKAHDDSPVLSWLYSENKLDRARDVILQEGWDFTNYGFKPLGGGRFEPTGKGNPVVLWGHAHGADHMADVPIARTIGLRIEDGTRTIGDQEFAVNEYDFSATIYRLAKGKFIHSNSVGFRPLATKELTDEEREAYGVGKFGRVFSKQELLEDSLCAVPCLPSALQNAVKSNELQSKDADFMAAITDPTEREWEKYVRRRARRFVALGGKTSTTGAAAPQESVAPEAEEAESGGALSVLRALSSELTALREAHEDDAASRRMLARALTDLSSILTSRLGAPRAVDSARSGVDAKAINAADAEKLRKQCEAILSKT